MTIQRLLIAASALALAVSVTAAASSADAATMMKMSHGKTMKKPMMKKGMTMKKNAM